MSNVARLSTGKKPAMWVTVVSSGPDATAGLTPTPFSIEVTVPPMEAVIALLEKACEIIRAQRTKGGMTLWGLT